MMSRQTIFAVLVSVLAAGCAQSPTSAIPRQAAPDRARFDDATSPPPPSNRGGNLMGSGT